MSRGEIWKRCDGDMIKEIFKIGCFGMKRVEIFFIILVTKWYETKNPEMCQRTTTLCKT